MKLYELPAKFAEFETMLIDGELTDDAMARLTELEASLTEKVQSCLCVMRNFDARASARKEEAKRLNALAQTDSQSAERLKKYVQQTLERLGMKSIETPLFKARLQNNPPGCTIEEGTELPPWLVRIVPEVIEPDKKAIMDAHKAGQPLPEGVKITQTQSLRIS
jgi:hypothetical protein